MPSSTCECQRSDGSTRWNTASATRSPASTPGRLLREHARPVASGHEQLRGRVAGADVLCQRLVDQLEHVAREGTAVRDPPHAPRATLPMGAPGGHREVPADEARGRCVRVRDRRALGCAARARRPSRDHARDLRRRHRHAHDQPDRRADRHAQGLPRRIRVRLAARGPGPARHRRARRRRAGARVRGVRRRSTRGRSPTWRCRAGSWRRRTARTGSSTCATRWRRGRTARSTPSR